ncbi:MAG: 2-amino-4-hydroxy-6-hydroxymethyldihydropteridine diphosphokinase [Holosporales bacterium]|jgi:2-amino-4-hydroxy-6-hydroxymethyldihydropteridine diphosphokinase
MRAYLSLGSNMGDSHAILSAAVQDIAALGTVLTVSRHYQSPAMYYTDQPDFLNMAVALDTTLEPLGLLQELQALEQRHGRTRPFANSPRVLDIDIIDYKGLILNALPLILPHPRLGERAFVLRPLAEIAPDWVCPRTGTSITSLLELIKNQHCHAIPKA